MSAKAKSAVDHLAGLEERVEEAEQRQADVLAERGRAGRAVDAARAQEAAHHEAVAAGDDAPDADREVALKATVADAERDAAEHVWQGKAAGAERAVLERREEARRYAVERFADLAAEHVLADGPARDRLQAAFEELGAAEELYAGRLRSWHGLARYGVLDIADVPGLPTRGDDDEVRSRFALGIDAPTPRSLLEDEGEGKAA